MEQLEEFKREAAERAVADWVRAGMAIGLGTGSTARYAVLAVGRLLAEGALREIAAVPTSEATATLARSVGITLVELADQPRLDVTIDGADEVSPELHLTKGGGGALLREKIVASASERLVIVADHTKVVRRLGERMPIPVEVTPFAVPVATPALAALGAEATLRVNEKGAPFVTDEGHRIVDCRFAPIADPVALAAAIISIPGVVEHGMFLGMTAVAYLAGPGGVETRRR